MMSGKCYDLHIKYCLISESQINTEEDLRMEPIYVTGHCNPDADLSVAAIDYAVQEGRTAE